MPKPPHNYDNAISACCGAKVVVNDHVIEGEHYHVNYFTSCSKCGFVCTAFQGSKEELKKYREDIKNLAPDPEQPFTDEDLRQAGLSKDREKPKDHIKRAKEHFESAANEE